MTLWVILLGDLRNFISILLTTFKIFFWTITFLNFYFYFELALPLLISACFPRCYCFLVIFFSHSLGYFPYVMFNKLELLLLSILLFQGYNFNTCFTTFCKFIWHYKKTLRIYCFCNHQTVYTLSPRLMSKSLSYFKAVTFCLLHFALKILFHFASKSCYTSR